jgi:hypothetical protein
MSNTDGFFALSEEETTSFAAYEKEALANDPPEEELEPEAEAPAEAEADAEEPDLEPDDDDEIEPKESRNVRLRIKKEAEKRRAAEARAVDLERQNAITLERLNILAAAIHGEQEQTRQAAQQPQAEEDPMPDPDQDIFAFAKWQARQLERVKSEQQQFAQLQQQQRQTYEQQQQFQAFAREVQAEEARFQAQKPDYGDAVNHVRSHRVNAYQMLGYSPEQAAQLVDRDALNFVAQLRQSGRPIAESIYEFARSQGYKPGAAQAETPRDESGRFRSERIETATRAQTANKSLSGSAGTATSAAVTGSDIAKMSAKEFERFLERDAKNGYKISQKLFG